jgi:hypothetical protein
MFWPSLWLSLCFCFALVSLFSETVISIQPDHECYGADCPVCLLVQQAEIFFRQLKNAAALHAGFPAVMMLIVVFVLKRGSVLFIPMTAVRLKVKINR